MDILTKLKIKPPDNSPTMKHNHNHDNARNTGLQLVTVRFEFTHPTATTVCVAGTFNQWQPEAKTLHSSGVGHWWKETALAPGTYEYCLIVDGQWMPDPLARESVPNPFGGRNSILKVASSPEAAHRADAENLPLKNVIQQQTPKTEQTNTGNGQ
jgi:1,4-alpha-glucan branching enzyme